MKGNPLFQRLYQTCTVLAIFWKRNEHGITKLTRSEKYVYAFMWKQHAFRLQCHRDLLIGHIARVLGKSRFWRNAKDSSKPFRRGTVVFNAKCWREGTNCSFSKWRRYKDCCTWAWQQNASRAALTAISHLGIDKSRGRNSMRKAYSSLTTSFNASAGREEEDEEEENISMLFPQLCVRIRFGPPLRMFC